MEIYLLKGKDPIDDANPVKTWIVVAEREVDARKLLPAIFEVYGVAAHPGDLGGMPGIDEKPRQRKLKVKAECYEY